MPEKPFKLDELGSSYVLAGDRFVVSFIIGIGHDAATPEEALQRALDMIQNESYKTEWHLFDRTTAEMHVYRQEEFDPAYD